jgi:hypothetical protein
MKDSAKVVRKVVHLVAQTVELTEFHWVVTMAQSMAVETGLRWAGKLAMHSAATRACRSADQTVECLVGPMAGMWAIRSDIPTVVLKDVHSAELRVGCSGPSMAALTVALTEPPTVDLTALATVEHSEPLKVEQMVGCWVDKKVRHWVEHWVPKMVARKENHSVETTEQQ